MLQMSSRTPANSHPERDRDPIVEAAYSWFLRQRSGPLSDTQKQEFEAWYAADPAHPQAYHEAEQLWADPALTGALRAQRQARAHRRRNSSRLGLAAAAVALWVVIAFDPLIRLQADHWTAWGEVKRMTLADGSQVSLNTDTAISLDLERGQRRLRLLKGEVYCEVTADPNRPFVVTAPYSTTRVAGTGFVVRAEQDNDTVGVLQGAVQVTSHTGSGAPRLVGPERQVAVSRAGLSESERTPNASLIDWAHGDLVFEQTPLAQALERVQHYWRGVVLFRDPRLRTFKLSGRFAIKDPDLLLDILVKTLPIKIRRITPWVVVVG